MRSKLRRELVDRFSSQIALRLPQFQRRISFEGLDPCPIWAWELSPALTCFVMLQPFEDWDQFVIEIGWSENREFPWRTPPSGPLKFEPPRFRVRLARLWATGKRADVWSIVPAGGQQGEQATSEEDLFPRVSELVADAVQKLIVFGMPVFQRLANTTRM
jgi:hypothetical protein